MRDHLRCDHHQHAQRTAGQGEDVLLDVRRARREVQYQVVEIAPVRVDKQPADQQLRHVTLDGQGLVLAEQERGRRELHPVLGDGLQPGIRRARPGEQRHA